MLTEMVGVEVNKMVIGDPENEIYRDACTKVSNHKVIAESAATLCTAPEEVI